MLLTLNKHYYLRTQFFIKLHLLRVTSFQSLGFLFQSYLCIIFYSGVRCDLDVDECLSHPCRNNGTCINLINDFECRCAPGYTGKDCSIDIDECASNPCFKGSTCINEIADFTCVCIPGMTGRLCEIDIDDCEVNSSLYFNKFQTFDKLEIFRQIICFLLVQRFKILNINAFCKNFPSFNFWVN